MGLPLLLRQQMGVRILLFDLQAHAPSVEHMLKHTTELLASSPDAGVGKKTSERMPTSRLDVLMEHCKELRRLEAQAGEELTTAAGRTGQVYTCSTELRATGESLFPFCREPTANERAAIAFAAVELSVSEDSLRMLSSWHHDKSPSLPDHLRTVTALGSPVVVVWRAVDGSLRCEVLRHGQAAAAINGGFVACGHIILSYPYCYPSATPYMSWRAITTWYPRPPPATLASGASCHYPAAAAASSSTAPNLQGR